MKGLPQNVLLNFRLEFPKSDLTTYLPSGISERFCQMVSTPGMSRGSPIMFFNPVIPTQNFVQSGFPRIIFGIPSKHTFNPESHSDFVFKPRIPSLIQIREIAGAEKPLGTLCPVLLASTERAIEKSNNILCINSDSHTLSIADSKRKTKISCTSCNFRLSLRALR